MQDLKLQSYLNLLETHRKESIRLGTLVYLLPFFYILLDFQWIGSVNLGFVVVEKSEFVVLLTPVVYTMLFLVLALKSLKVLEIINEIKQITGNDSATEKCLDYLSPSHLLNKVYDAFELTQITSIIYLLPVTLLIVIGPLAFISYGIVRIGQLMAANGSFLNVNLFILSLWLLIGSIYLWIQVIRKDK
ncbi:MAG: hypothetical protein WBG46_06320 [Nonlabens sp.]